ncbi:MAG: FtsW/RodA/SpoVE family cell cycle protein, partial [Lachnospiraceae bacterium]|nr:FtsW/RodA/SpoVE family cell cycle protein [Lachnospiraceae bacterium]
METYLEKLLSQIRCKKARPYIAEEIRDHIESQIADNLSEGMSYEEAEKNAVTDMGDPVEVGISLDRIHKPKIAWKLLVIVGILSLLGILIQQSILRQPGYQELE